MLSLGPSRTGLPLHSHGKTWIALIHGSKRWLAYPPGHNAPPALQQRFNPLKPVHAWLEEIYPELAGLPVAPVDGVSSSASAGSGSGPVYTRPVECLQRPGDIVYLPAGWVHMTVNVGEAIGIGGQASMPVDERLRVGREAVASNPDNFDGHKFVALALAHQGLEEEHRFKSQLTATSAGLVQLREDNFADMVLAGEDTWLVHFSSPDSEALAPEVARVWNQAADKLRGLVSVGAMNVTREWAPELAAEIAASGGRPVVKVLLGSGDRASAAASLAAALPMPAPEGAAVAEAVAASERESEAEGRAKSSGASASGLVDFALACTALQGGQRAGSAIAITAKSKRLFAEAEKHQRRCLALQPLHPEGHGLLAELLGHAGLGQSMGEALVAAEAVYDGLDPDDASPHSLASVYHKLATVYLGVRLSAHLCAHLSVCVCVCVCWP